MIKTIATVLITATLSQIALAETGNAYFETKNLPVVSISGEAATAMYNKLEVAEKNAGPRGMMKEGHDFTCFRNGDEDVCQFNLELNHSGNITGRVVSNEPSNQQIEMGPQTSAILINYLKHSGTGFYGGLGQGWNVYAATIRCYDPVGTGNASDKKSCTADPL